MNSADITHARYEPEGAHIMLAHRNGKRHLLAIGAPNEDLTIATQTWLARHGTQHGFDLPDKPVHDLTQRDLDALGILRRVVPSMGGRPVFAWRLEHATQSPTTGGWVTTPYRGRNEPKEATDHDLDDIEEVVLNENPSGTRIHPYGSDPHSDARILVCRAIPAITTDTPVWRITTNDDNEHFIILHPQFVDEVFPTPDTPTLN